MLKSINIKNIILIDEIEVDFADGFTSLTGETGAGKSIILTALGLLLGKKIDKSAIRFGQDFAQVSGEFKVSEKIKTILEENDIEADELLIRRKITQDGKTKQFVNDTSVSLKLLAEIGANLVEIHSQHEQSSLFEPSIQREIVDKFAGINLEELAAIFSEWKDAEKELEERKAAIEKARQEEDYLRHVLDELTELDPQEGEEGELAETRSNMKNYEQIAATLNDAEAELTRDKNIENALLNAQKTLMRANNDIFGPAIEVLERASIEVNEVFASMQEIANSMESDPARLNEVEERLFAIRGLARKYDCHPDQLADYKAEIETKLDLLGNEERGIKELSGKVKTLQASYIELAKDVSENRKKAAAKMQKEVEAELKPLAMGGAKYEIDFSESQPSQYGIDKVEFIASTNPGTPMSSLAKIASGGEISRFMLALKVVLLNVSAAPTIIFDEIDTGTGGSVAAAIGERLAKLGKGLQVFVVTHLPQVAAQAQNHMRISKAEKSGSNFTNVEVLTGEERKDELARMLSGAELTDEARAQAIKLMG